MFTGGAPHRSGQKNVGDSYFVKVMGSVGSSRRHAHARFPRKGRARTLTILATAVLLLPALAASGAFLAFGGGRSNADTRTYSLFAATDAPKASTNNSSGASANDWGSVEVGVRFAPAVDGYVTGVRFFKGNGNTGTHTGTLWSSGGSALATATFSAETDTGWQSVTFAQPVQVSANQRYVASYHAAAGHYAFSQWYFDGASIDNGVLRAPASTRRDGNGVYSYGSRTIFPTSTWKATNYWVDVTFTTAAPSGTTIAPTVASTTAAPTTTAAPPTTVRATTTTVAPTTTVPNTTTTVATPTTPAPAPTTTVPIVSSTPPPSTGFPNTSNAGVPAGAQLAMYTGPTTITSCGVVIDHKIIPASLTIRATNGNSTITNSESAARSNACVILTNDLIAPGADCGTGCAGVDTSYSTSPACTVGGAARPCGPVFIADSEVSMPVSPSGFSYGFKETNIHGWRVYSHGTNQGGNCDGFCEFHDSLLVADRVDAAGKAHMDGLSSNGNGGRAILLDHNTLLCTLTNTGVSLSGGGCSGDLGLFGDFAAVSNVTVTDNQFMASGDPAYCAYTGASQPAKAYPKGDHLVWRNNVFLRGSNSKCATYGPVADWQSGGTGNVSCNNNWTDGSAVMPNENC
jgi:hypothetical protein